MSEVEPTPQFMSDSISSEEATPRVVLPNTPRKVGKIVLADRYTEPIPDVSPEKEAEYVERMAALQVDLKAITQPYYDLALPALSDDGYKKTKDRGWRSKTGRAQWEYIPEYTDAMNRNEALAYRYAVRYGLDKPHEVTALELGVRRALFNTDEQFQLVVGFDEGIAQRVELHGRKPTYDEVEGHGVWPPMFTLRILMNELWKKQHPDNSDQIGISDSAKDMLIGDQWEKADVVVDFGNLPISVAKETTNYLGSYRKMSPLYMKPEPRSRKMMYDPATDSFYKKQGVANAESVKEALAWLLGIIPTHEL